MPDNFSLRILGGGLGLEPVRAVIRELHAPGFWGDGETRRKLLSVAGEVAGVDGARSNRISTKRRD